MDEQIKNESLSPGPDLDLAFYDDERKPQVRKTQFVNFLLGNEWYAVEISHVSHICRVFEITPLPCAPNHIAGIVNLRGNILSVTDLKKLFGLLPVALTKESRIVVLSVGGIETGIVVDKISNVIDVDLAKIDPPLETLEPEKAEFIIGECKLDSVFFAILNAEKILALKERQV